MLAEPAVHLNKHEIGNALFFSSSFFFGENGIGLKPIFLASISISFCAFPGLALSIALLGIVLFKDTCLLGFAVGSQINYLTLFGQGSFLTNTGSWIGAWNHIRDGTIDKLKF